ncbi:MAG: 3-hydroxyacyl-CoA dehydrogenase NAD-binding domain-containing protein [Absicoccus sp.]|uniref:3-hydroxyacyl-CoA dehydrogenase NAD-binding domain-containing protein n=1 Tax=Absicoccus intestinalis TaxID=2926319 RepID=A0ABU4WLS3_9FIRM|nr:MULTISPECIES: 3-hydroxyacyl-CoA dehydrogenase NAD-binding domain-containing protein [unclassified Absicoccus]MDX8416427.1 3-hydroxyacyl-CoA dehydrogenase NAD-binding domain-containing protein [Absicoccus sp. CLA-KB-P134]MDY3035722.1 3-hydroxyacyl-CoA dehydrogenase NAD-binding domain-containing protein [Absicoccus sp.]
MQVGICGAGTMGHSMAEIFAKSGYTVTLYNHRLPTLEKAKTQIDPSVRDAIVYTTSWDDLYAMDLIVENVKEDMDVKLAFYQELSKHIQDTTIVATNTSGLSINALSKGISHPERFIGFHWFNPPTIIPLIEIIKGDQTTDTIAQTIYDVALSLDKKPVMVNKDVLGFAANRVQLAVVREVLDLVDRGIVSKEGADDLMKYGLGFRWACLGPLETLDFGGLDTFYHISEYLIPDLCDSHDVPKILAENYEKGRYGIKTKAGFYDYPDDLDQKKTQERDQKLAALYNALYKK